MSFLDNLSAFVGSIPGNISQGLIWGIMAIGLYITYKILDIADLTVDGSFCTGGAVCAAMLVAGYPVWLALVGAFVGGMVAGLVTALLHTKCRIPAILAGILTQMGLWTVNMLAMGGFKEMKNNVAISADKYDPLVAKIFEDDVAMGFKPFYRHPVFVLVVLSAVLIAVLYWFFGTERGCSIRATGANEHMARAQGINTQVNKIIGLVLSNGLVALSGALLSQYNGTVDINLGKGAIVIGLAAVIIGEVTFGRLFKNFALKLTAVSLGAIIYYLIIQVVITLIDVDTQYMKLFSAFVVAVFLTLPSLSLGKKHKGKKVAGHA